jgi:hypothetical protein
MNVQQNSSDDNRSREQLEYRVVRPDFWGIYRCYGSNRFDALLGALESSPIGVNFDLGCARELQWRPIGGGPSDWMAEPITEADVIWVQEHRRNDEQFLDDLNEYEKEETK